MSTPRFVIKLIHLHEPIGWRYLVYDRHTHRWAGEENGYATREEASAAAAREAELHPAEELELDDIDREILAELCGQEVRTA